MRSPHYLARSRVGDVPLRMVAVECDGALIDVPGVGIRQREILKGWTACGYDDDRRSPIRLWERSGGEGAQLWEAADWHLSRGGICWIVVHNARRALTLLDLWAAMERKDLVVYEQRGKQSGHSGSGPRVRRVRRFAPDCDGGDSGLESDGMSDVREPIGVPGRPGVGGAGSGIGASGYVVLEERATILQLCRPGKSGRLMVVDSRNHGIDLPDDVIGAPARARWLRDAYLEMTAVLRSRSWGALKATAGAQAMHVFRAHHLTHSMHVHCDAAALKLEGEAYYGGRCEPLFVGRCREEVYHVDVRGMYPALCASVRLPCALLGTADATVASIRADALDCPCSVARVTIRTDEPAYPRRADGRLSYPVGRFDTALCGPELADAAAHGRILAVHSVATYAMAPALASAAAAFTGLCDALRGTPETRLLGWAKRMAVCLPGKFGQRGGTWQPYLDAPDHAPWTSWALRQADKTVVRCRDIAGQAQWERQEPWGAESIPAISAWITSAGRMQLLNYIRAAGWEEVLYVDTDSVFVTARGYVHLKERGMVGAGETGHLRLVERYRDCHIYGPKWYAAGGNVICAGRPKSEVVAGPVEGTYWFSTPLALEVKKGRVPTVERSLRPFAPDQTSILERVGSDGRVRPVEVWEPLPDGSGEGDSPAPGPTGAYARGLRQH